MLIKGAVKWNSEVLQLVGTGSPGGYTDGITYSTGYYRGDVQYRSNVATGGFIGDVCTVEGNPGTWKTWGVVS